MKKAEIISSILAVLASVGNLYLVPGSEAVLVTSLSTLGILYIFGGMSGFQVNLKAEASFENQMTQFIYKIGGYSMAVFAIGVLFYQLFWPGHKAMIIAGFSSCILSLGFLLFKKKEVKSEDVRKLFPRLFAWVFLGGLFVFLPQQKWVAIKYKNHPSVVESFERMQKAPKNDSLKDLFQKSKKEIE
ncbi:MAG: hypothetical protein COA32_07060 [Fluviicola sp.]|nr:MAG: hypothetical protein COA32_07060 [Fluviicola sp.]